jgi:hypothetical protein
MTERGECAQTKWSPLITKRSTALKMDDKYKTVLEVKMISISWNSLCCRLHI